jgi:hypothetical protein
MGDYDKTDGYGEAEECDEADDHNETEDCDS